MDAKLGEGEAARDGQRILEEDPQITSLEVVVLADKVDLDKDREAVQNKEKNASGESVAVADAKKDDRKKFEEAIVVVVTLIITLTYQALLNPPSTLFTQGTETDWGCLGKHLGRGLISGMKKCPAGLAFAFLFLNTTVFLTSVLILALALRGSGVFLLKTLTVSLTVSYCILLMAFSYDTAYVAIPLCCVAFSFFSAVIWIPDGAISILMLFIMNPQQRISELMGVITAFVGMLQVQVTAGVSKSKKRTMGYIKGNDGRLRLASTF